MEMKAEVFSPATQPSQAQLCLSCQDERYATITELCKVHDVALPGVRGYETASHVHAHIL